MLSIGLASVTFRSLQWEQVLSVCRDAGLSSIEWGGDVHVPAGDTARAAAVAHATEAAHLRVASYGSYYRCGEDSDEAFRMQLETARALGAPILRLWAGSRGSAAVSAEDYERFVWQTRAQCILAREAGVMPAFEYHPRTLTDRAESACRLVRDIGDTLCGVYYQYDPSRTKEENVRALTVLLPYLKMVHVFYVDPQFRRLSLRDPGGIELWRELCAVLRSARTTVDLLFEFLAEETLEALCREVDCLRAVLEAEEMV